jgi:hypothetical protein
MFLVWFAALFLWGFVGGFNNIPTVAWLLLIPFGFQDLWDVRHK